MEFSARISPAAMTWLGSAFDEKTAISPLTTIQVPGFAEEDKKSLEDQGVLDGAGSFTPNAFAVFQELASARRFGGFRISGSFGLIDKMVYFGNRFKVAVDNGADALVITANQPVEGIRDILGDIVGSSRLMNTGLDIHMGEKAALVFASLLDLTRWEALTYYAGEREPQVFFSRERIHDIVNGDQDQRWIVGHLKRMPLEGLPVTTEDIAASLAALEEAGVVTLNPEGAALSGDAAAVAGNLLILEQQVFCTAGEIKGSEVYRSDALFLQGGLLDILMLDSGAAGIGFTSVSPAQMNQMLESIMTQPPEL